MLKPATTNYQNVIHYDFHYREENRPGFPCASDMVLGESEIHLWKIPTESLWERLRELYETLDAAEQNQLNRYLLIKQRTRFITRQGILRKILGAYLNMNPGAIRFGYRKNGKPMLENIPQARIIHFSLSFSHNLIVIALSRFFEIGVDIEYLEDIPEIDKVAARFFSGNETAEFLALPQHQKTRAFFNCWTRKQAFLKAVGNRNLDAFNRFDVSFAPGEPAQLLRIDGNSQEALRWSIQEIIPGLNYTGALVVGNHDFQLKMFEEWNKDYMIEYKLAA